MKTPDKLTQEWQAMSLNEQFDNGLPPRICKELPQCQFPGLAEQTDIEKSYFIFGEAGTGKTLYSVALVREILRRNYLGGRCLVARFITFDDILLEIRSSFNQDSVARERDIIDRYRQADWLILDDFGASKQSDWTYQVLYSIINYRYEYLKPVIITSNFSLPQLAEKLGDDRTVSRLLSMCNRIEMKTIKRKSL